MFSEKSRNAFFVLAALLTLFCARICHAGEAVGAGVVPVTEGEAVDMIPATEEEGMLSPPSEASADSVFGRASSREAVTDEKLDALLARLQESLPTDNGSWSLYICDLAGGFQNSIRDQSQQAASLIKLYIMGAVFENYDTLIRQYGQSSVDTCLESMITVSDNDAANTLVSYLGNGDSSAGMDAVNTFCQTHGFTATSMGRLLLQSSEYGDNYTSVSDCGRFLKALYERNTEEYPFAEEMFSLLAAQTRRNKIPARLPEGVSVANKTGELSDVENDAGVIYDAGNDLVVVFMSEYLTDVSAAQETIAALSRQIYDTYNPS